MKKFFDIKDYPLIKIAMHCQTEEEAIAFLEYLHSVGRKWNNGQSYKDMNYFYKYGADTCYAFQQHKFGNLHYYKSNEFVILEFEDFYWGKSFDIEISEEDEQTISNFLECFSVSE